VKKAFNLLLKAGLVNKVNSISSLDLPFNLKNSSKKFKALFLDVGLWQNLCGMPVDMEIRKNGIMNAYRGALAEQFAGQEIAALIKGNPVYWARDAKSSSAEVDYAVEFKGIVYPVEVKSSSSGSLKSLHLALETYKNCPWGIVLSTRPFQILKEQKLMFVPIYYAGILDRICS
jgi:predicted AAA+ superfamily ATPase